MSVNVFLSSISILNIPTYWFYFLSLFRRQRSSRPEVFLGKVVLEICSKFTGEHPCRSAISIKLQSNFIEITLQHGCFPVICYIFPEHLFLRIPLDGCFSRQPYMCSIRGLFSEIYRSNLWESSFDRVSFQ